MYLSSTTEKRFAPPYIQLAAPPTHIPAKCKTAKYPPMGFLLKRHLVHRPRIFLDRHLASPALSLLGLRARLVGPTVENKLPTASTARKQYSDNRTASTERTLNSSFHRAANKNAAVSHILTSPDRVFWLFDS